MGVSSRIKKLKYGNTDSNTYNIVIHDQEKSSNPSKPTPKNDELTELAFVKQHKMNSEPLIEVTGKEKGKQSMASNTSVVIECKDMMQSSVIQSFKSGKMRKCLSVDFVKKEEKKMKLKDYLYLNELSGVRKKIPVQNKE